MTTYKTTIRALSLFFALTLALSSCKQPTNPDTPTDYIHIKGTQFELHGKRYAYLGTNFWYGLNLGSKGAGGDRARLTRELDRLKALGINNLRIMAGSEGPDTEPYRMVPALQSAPGVYNPEVLDGLDYLLQEMETREMYAIMCLTNFWNWSGGMAQYLVWANAADSIPYPPPHPGGDWGRYQEFTAQFYTNTQAVGMLDNHIKFIVARYRENPTVMAWQLGNEPRGVNNVDAYRRWVSQSAALIKSLDKNHLVTIGSEGTTSSTFAGTDPEKDHADPNIDYITLHIWVQNWGIYDPAKPDSTLARSVEYALRYLAEHEGVARTLNKPLVMEEFGISRDGNNHDPAAAVTVRDQYYTKIFDAVYQYANKPHSVMAGVNFWAWGGEGRPRVPEGIWKAGDDFIGDPPHETQGWYSVYDTDTTTQAIIRRYAEQMNALQ
jgi:mannan endo-1,4-beta-mannosidase